MVEFTPGWRWRSLMLVLAIALLAGGIGLGLFAFHDGPWLLLIATPCAILGSAMAVRVPFVRIAYGPEHVRVDGILWSRSIRRTNIESVRINLDEAAILWHTDTHRPMTTPLTVMQPGRLGWLPYNATHRRRAFLKKLQTWSQLDTNP